MIIRVQSDIGIIVTIASGCTENILTIKPSKSKLNTKYILYFL